MATKFTVEPVKRAWRVISRFYKPVLAILSDIIGLIFTCFIAFTALAMFKNADPAFAIVICIAIYVLGLGYMFRVLHRTYIIVFSNGNRVLNTVSYLSLSAGIVILVAIITS